MSKRYKVPPIVEALCEFQFANTDLDVPWDITLIGLVYDKLKGIFPKKQQLPLNLAIVASSEINEQNEEIPLLPLIRLSSSDDTKLVQLGQNLLTVNHLKPYSSWEEFLPIIENALKEYIDVAKPKKFRRLALKYNNRIEVPKIDINLEKLFQFRPLIPQNLSENIEAFLIGANLPQNEEDVLRMQLGTINSGNPDTLAFLLEITYVFSRPREIPLADALQRLDTAHKHVEEAFEACLTNELKQMFGEVKE